MSVVETNPAGVFGPRGCAPLTRPFRQRINAEFANWRAPTATPVFAVQVNTNPVLVVPANANRAHLSIYIRVQPTAGIFLFALGVVPSPADGFSITPCRVFNVNNNVFGSATFDLQYVFDGGFCTAAWYASAQGTFPDAGAVCATEQLYLG